MTFSDAEVRSLARQPRGHLSTQGSNGTPQHQGFAARHVSPADAGDEVA